MGGSPQGPPVGPRPILPTSASSPPPSGAPPPPGGVSADITPLEYQTIPETSQVIVVAGGLNSLINKLVSDKDDEDGNKLPLSLSLSRSLSSLFLLLILYKIHRFRSRSLCRHILDRSSSVAEIF